MMYELMYRLEIRPWERKRSAGPEELARVLDREDTDHPRGARRVLDIGCGRGQYAAEFVRRGWDYVGVDYVPSAIDAARALELRGATFLVGDATKLPALGLGEFDLFFDMGCFQGFKPEQRRKVGAGVTVLARPGATLLQFSFGPTMFRRFIGGVTEDEVRDAHPGWVQLTAEPADAKGLGWPMSASNPQWYRLAYKPD